MNRKNRNIKFLLKVLIVFTLLFHANLNYGKNTISNNLDAAKGLAFFEDVVATKGVVDKLGGELRNFSEGWVGAWEVLNDIADATSVALKTDVVFLERFNSLLQNPQYSNILDPLTSGAHNKLLGHGVNNTEEAAMKLFVADDYYKNYNKALAGEISMTPEYHAMKELMEAGHTKLPKVDDAVVFRGAGSEESTFASNLVNGLEFHFNGRFTSSSYEEHVADLFRQGNGGSVIWKIESKTGVDIKKINQGESEVLFKPFTNYKLLDVSPSSTNSQVSIYTIKEL